MICDDCVHFTDEEPNPYCDDCMLGSEFIYDDGNYNKEET